MWNDEIKWPISVCSIRVIEQCSVYKISLALFTLLIHSPIALNASGHLGSQLYMKNPRMVNSLANIDGFSLGPVVRIVKTTKG